MKPELGSENSQMKKGKGRDFTVSIALPGSILDNIPSQELRSYVSGEIARAAAIYQVDEIVIFKEDAMEKMNDFSESNERDSMDSTSFLNLLLTYLETPQYLRKALFPLSPALRFAGLMNPLDAPHHLRVNEICEFREAVVIPERNDQISSNQHSTSSLADCGLRSMVRLNEEEKIGTRITVRLLDGGNIGAMRSSKKQKVEKFKRGHGTLQGIIEKNSTPAEELGLYWGYKTRVAGSLSQVFSGCPWGEYDVAIGTSDKGDSIYSSEFELKTFKYVF